MKNIIMLTAALGLGVCIGAVTFYIYMHSYKYKAIDLPVGLSEVLDYSHIPLTDSGYACIDEEKRTVGAITASIFENNMLRIHNQVSMDCFEDKCALIYNDCPPWKSQECWSRVLRFDLDDRQRIDPTTFACIDLP